MRSEDEIKEYIEQLTSHKKRAEANLNDTAVCYGYIKALKWVLQEDNQ